MNPFQHTHTEQEEKAEMPTLKRKVYTIFLYCYLKTEKHAVLSL